MLRLFMGWLERLQHISTYRVEETMHVRALEQVWFQEWANKAPTKEQAKLHQMEANRLGVEVSQLAQKRENRRGSRFGWRRPSKEFQLPRQVEQTWHTKNLP